MFPLMHWSCERVQGDSGTFHCRQEVPRIVLWDYEHEDEVTDIEVEAFLLQ
jgi:hypothetical protein